jgi:hypothetical protein
MQPMSLEVIWDYEHKIEEIFINHAGRIEKIEEIRSLMSDESIKIKVEKIMDDIGAKRLEDLGMFSDTILRMLTKHKGK